MTQVIEQWKEALSSNPSTAKKKKKKIERKKSLSKKIYLHSCTLHNDILVNNGPHLLHT
jgi:hypothetical protein